MSPPAKLYKYEALTAQTLQNLKSQILYFGSPLGFNDPYDCALTPSIRVPPDDEVEVVRQHYLAKEQPGSARQMELQSKSTGELREMLMRATKGAITTQIDNFLKTKGVTCFSEINDDLLMWSHYGGKYRGMCLEFSTESEPFSKARQVNYVERPPSVTVRSLLVDKSFDPVADLFATKSRSWSYEREWRAIHSQAGTKYVYEPSTLTGVYFGPDVERQALEIVCLILAGQNESVQFWEGRRSREDFKVLFTPFTYTPHLGAKKKGLPGGDKRGTDA